MCEAPERLTGFRGVEHGGELAGLGSVEQWGVEGAGRFEVNEALG